MSHWRASLQYRERWVRLFCCFSWALVVINALHFDVLNTIDLFLLNVLVGGNRWVFPFVGPGIEMAVVLGVTLAPAVPRFDRPVALVLFAGGTVFGTLLTTAVIFAATGIVLPLASPLLGGIGAVAILQTMAWSEERSRRTGMEAVDHARLQFTDMLVHDLRKHLSSVFVSLNLLEKDRVRTEASAELLRLLRVGADRVLLDINNLLDIRKIEEQCLVLRREPVRIDQVIDVVLREHASAADLAGIRMIPKIEPVPPVQADAEVVSRILVNLIWNALRHAPGGSTIEAGCLALEDRVEWWVSNGGPAIPEEGRKILFQSFRTGQGLSIRDGGGGTGLGLSFCKMAIEAHGGTIAVESPRPETGDGVRVRVSLPVA
ncbi:MAG: hypothetical protein A2340_08680 [Lentisphaerae bacterium RIFOXYB12_FULL_60_10]|nr:MAG: hypothetical protein A2340_08680 [Lentisphaerae bacterium RIFOXYB12_FULL_60_10]